MKSMKIGLGLLGLLTIMAGGAGSAFGGALGGVGSGGGCLVADARGRSTLKDLVVFRPGFEDPAPAGAEISDSRDRALARMHFTKLDGRFGSVDIRSTPAFAGARRIIQAWSPYYSTLSQSVLEALGTLQIYATDYYTEYPVQGCDGPGERPLFAYDARLMGPILSIPRWNEVSLLTQSAGLIKEAFRLLAFNTPGSVVTDAQLRNVPELESRLSHWVGALVLDRPGPDNPVIDSLIVPGTSFDADRKRAQLARDYRKVCQEFADVERRLGRPEVSCKITNPDLDRQAIALLDRISGEIGKHDPEFNFRNHLFDFQQKLMNIQDNAITMSVGELLSSPELAGALHDLTQVTRKLQLSRPGALPGYVRTPIDFDDVRKYLSRDEGFFGRLLDPNSAALRTGVREFQSRFQELLRRGELLPEER